MGSERRREDRLFVAGLSHRTAPVALRERLAPQRDQVPGLLRELVRQDGTAEIALVHTCNRFEVYGVTTAVPIDLAPIFAVLAARLGVDLSAHRACLYVHEGAPVAAHLLRVAASLDSLIVGESQILGQVKDAYRDAVEAGTTGKILNRLFHRALEAGKRVRTETRIGHNAVSVSHAAVELAHKIFGKIEGKKVLVIGVGEMSELTAQHLRGVGVGDLFVANRTMQGAVNMADRFDGRAVDLAGIDGLLERIDIVITATGAAEPLLSAATVERALERRKQRPLFLIDIAVPRDVDPAVGELPNAYLFNIDDLQAVADKNYRERILEAQRAEELVREEAGRFESWLNGLRAVPLLERIRELGDQLAAEELARLSSRLARLDERERRAIAAALAGVVAKLLHRPIVNLKRLAGNGEADEVMWAAEELFFGESEKSRSDPAGDADDGAGPGPDRSPDDGPGQAGDAR
jgi:glutamyl-tRNA reductase